MNLACFHQIIVWWKFLKTIVWGGVAEPLASSKSQTVGVWHWDLRRKLCLCGLGDFDPPNHFFSSSLKTPLLSILQQRPCSKSEYKFWALVYQLCQIILPGRLIELRLLCTFAWILPCPFQHLTLSIIYSCHRVNYVLWDSHVKALPAHCRVEALGITRVGLWSSGTEPLIARRYTQELTQTWSLAEKKNSCLQSRESPHQNSTRLASWPWTSQSPEVRGNNLLSLVFPMAAWTGQYYYLSSVTWISI